MKLYAFSAALAATQPHDFALVGPGRQFESGGQGVSIDQQRVITHDLQTIRESLEQSPTLVVNDRSLAVHHPGRVDEAGAAELGETLVAEADSPTPGSAPRGTRLRRESGRRRRVARGPVR